MGFKKGHRYRIPMMLATSADPSVAATFLTMFSKSIDEYSPVLFKVHVDAELLCSHVNLLEALTTCRNEQEWLFVSYSAFVVEETPVVPSTLSASAPVEVTVKAYPDNQNLEDTLPIMGWH